ncbi:MAG: hypothetical protein ABIJ91_01310 [Candidatus Kuenenbacteria bacterium]
MLYLFLSLIVLICLGVIFFIIKKYAPKINSYNKQSDHHKEKQTQVKKQLIENKVQKKLRNLQASLINFSKHNLNQSLRIKNFLLSIKENRKQKKEALKPADRTGKPNINIDIIEAQVLVRKRKFIEAEKKFLSLLGSNPKNIDIYIGLGEIYTARKDFETAEKTYYHILKINSRYLAAYKDLAQVLKIQKKWQELKELSKQAIEIGYKETWLHINIGIAYKKTGYPESAEEWFKKAVEMEPRNEAFLDYLLEISIINKNRSLAHKTYNTLLDLSTDRSKLQSYQNKLDIL